jgi:hypothetical protein
MLLTNNLAVSVSSAVIALIALRVSGQEPVLELELDRLKCNEPPMGSVVEVTIRSDSVSFIEETRRLPQRQFEVNLRTPSVRRLGSR